jgi:hypothetical protein
MALLRFGCALIAAAATWASYGAQAEVTRIEIASRADILGGKPFGASGVYEKIVGKVFFPRIPAIRPLSISTRRRAMRMDA